MKILFLFIFGSFLLTACADGGSSSAQTEITAEALDDQSSDVNKTDEEAQDVEQPEEAFQHTKKITIMNYNINGIPCMRKNLISDILGFFDVDRCPTKTWYSKTIDERLKKLGDDLIALDKADKLPDILLIQEAFRGKIFQIDDDAVNKLIDRSPYPHKVMGPEARIENNPGDILKSFWKHKGLLNSGLIIFSKFPIHETDILKFGKLCAQGICNAEKGVVYARIKIPGVPKTIDIFNTHHQSFTEEENIRKKQNELMFDFMKKNDKSPWVVAGGDFNFKNSSPYVTFEHFMKGSKMDHAGLTCLDLTTCQIAEGTPRKFVKGDVLDHQFFAVTGDNFEMIPERIKFASFKFRGEDLSDHDYQLIEYSLFWNEP